MRTPIHSKGLRFDCIGLFLNVPICEINIYAKRHYSQQTNKTKRKMRKITTLAGYKFFALQQRRIRSLQSLN